MILMTQLRCGLPCGPKISGEDCECSSKRLRPWSFLAASSCTPCITPTGLWRRLNRLPPTNRPINAKKLEACVLKAHPEDTLYFKNNRIYAPAKLAFPEDTLYFKNNRIYAPAKLAFPVGQKICGKVCSSFREEEHQSAATLFDRYEELAFLKRFVRKRGRLLLLVGPHNCGKTAILEQLAKEENERVVMLNLRTIDTTSPAGLLEEVRQGLIAPDAPGQLRKFFEKALEGVSTTIGMDHPKIVDFLTFEKLVQPHVNLQKVVGKYLQERQEDMSPTIVIDEANKLHAWLQDEVSKRTLYTYLDFFVHITNEARLANVILVSSDFFFGFWLNEKIGADRYNVQVIGDLPKLEARGFFEFALGQPCQDELWNCLYCVYGGAVLPLLQIVESMQLHEVDWKEKVLQSFFQMESHTSMGLSPESMDPWVLPACWTRDQYVDILTKMTEYENGVAPWYTMQQKFGAQVLKALICYNLVQYRTKSIMARDIAWYKGPWPVVMSLSRMHWLAVKQLVAREKAENKHEHAEDFDWNQLMQLAGVWILAALQSAFCSPKYSSTDGMRSLEMHAQHLNGCKQLRKDLVVDTRVSELLL
ncbi:hypothetical protein GOP47_0024566 [Adiantum capillus-veneris]|uniref:AAA+ ATPase domain-containing protein n=1 Tax=Adiantum capillus-veneris TaxID=13818 RepID=A0A9D4Z560_ADICA|nr:hypothetical protein GOP47_0024566 [Adiantum capillus-veneris]